MSGESHPVVFAELLEELRREGFAVGTGHYLRLQQLLPHVAGLSPEELRTVLCPLFARNPDEQARFYRAYDEFMARAVPVTAATRGRTRTQDAAGRAPDRRAVARAALGTFALLAALALWLWLRHPRPQPADAGEIAQITITTATIATTTETVPAEQAAREDTPAAPVTTTRLVLWMGRFATEHPMAILTAALALLLLLELVRSIKREWHHRRNRGDGRPFVWPLRGDSAAPELFTSADFRDAVRLLREREGSGHERLDVPRTVHATARAGGDIVPVYREGRRPPEYLLLIERCGARDHLADYFEAIAHALIREGVVIERYEIESDLRTVRAPGSDEQLSTADLHARHPEHRLLVCASTPHAFLDPRTGEPVEWLDAALPWTQRGLVVADAGTANGRALRRLGFAVGDATANGLRIVAEQWNGYEDRRHRVRDLPPPLDDSLEEIRGSLTPAAWDLLVRCAAHSSVEWPLTCALVPPSWPSAETERVLFELSRLGWFRRGAIPQQERQLLLRDLEPDAEKFAVRETVVRVLGHNVPPATSTAARLREVAIESQRLWMHRDSRRAFRGDARRLRRYPLAMVYADAPLMALLRSAPATRLWHRVALPIRRLLFPSAAPALGFRSFVAVPVLSLLLVGALLRSGDPRPSLNGGDGGGAGASGGDVVSAEPQQDTMDNGPADVTSTETAATTVTLASPAAPTAVFDGGAATTGGPASTTSSAADTAAVPVLTATAAPAIDLSPAALRALLRAGPQPGAGGTGAPAESPVPEAEPDARLAVSLPMPDLIEPIGRIEFVSGRNNPVVFEWAPYGAYELVVWKGSTAGQPVFRTSARGAGYSWFPDTPLDPRATYSWTLRGAMVPRPLQPETFIPAFISSSDLVATSDEEQASRSRRVSKKVAFDIPCGTSVKGTKTVPFRLRNREELLFATAHLTVQTQLAGAPDLSDPFGKGNSVEFAYSFTAAPAGLCAQSARAEVTVTATLGPHKEEPPSGGGGGGGGAPTSTEKKKNE